MALRCPVDINPAIDCNKIKTCVRVTSILEGENDLIPDNQAEIARQLRKLEEARDRYAQSARDDNVRPTTQRTYQDQAEIARRLHTLAGHERYARPARDASTIQLPTIIEFYSTTDIMLQMPT